MMRKPVRAGVGCAALHPPYVFAAGLLLLAGELTWAGDAATDVKGKPAETKKLELHKLSNDDLLKQAAALHDRAAQDYLAQLRAVAAAEMMLKAVKDEAAALKSPEKKGDDKKPGGDGKKPDDKKPSEEDVAQAAVEAAGARQKTAKRSLELAQAEAEWLKQITARLDGARSAGIALQDAIEDLKGYVLEIELRIKDGSLAEEKVAPSLRPRAVEQKKSAVLEGLSGLKVKQEESQKALAAAPASQEALAKALRSADADLTLASKAFAREQKRVSMEKSHAAKKPEVLVAELDQLRQDGIGLKGTYELGIERFNARAKQADKLRLELDALKAPEAKIPQLTRAEDLEIASKSIKELIAFYAARAKKIDDLEAALTGLVKQGQEFEADAAVSSDHLFKMVVLSGLLQKAGFPEEKLAEEVRPKRLAAAAAREAKSSSDVLSAAEKAKGELPVLHKQLAETQAASDAAASQLENLVRSGEATLAALRWEGQLKGMSGQQAIDAFTKTRTQLDAKLELLKTQEQTYDKARLAATEARARLDAVKGPFLRAAAEEAVGEKQKLLAEFSKEAGLERPIKNGPPPGADMVKPPEKMSALEKKTEPDKRTELDKTTDELTSFQQAMAGRLQGLDEQHTKKQALLAALKELEETGGQLAKILGEARALALEGNVTAVDVKKRVGKGELTADKIPDGVNASLRGELRGKLDATAAAVLQALSQAQQARENIGRPDKNGDALKNLARDVLDLAGKRIDLVGDLNAWPPSISATRPACPPPNRSGWSRLSPSGWRATPRAGTRSWAWPPPAAPRRSKSCSNPITAS